MKRQPLTRHAVIALGTLISLTFPGVEGRAAPVSCFDDLKNTSRDHVSGGRVTDVPDGDTIVLENGVEVSLVGILPPLPPRWQNPAPDWSFASKAKLLLEQSALGQDVQLFFGKANTDRYGRAQAQILQRGSESGSSKWLQGHLVENGLARVYPLPDNRACTSDLLSLERRAREQAKGIWSSPHYQVRPHDQTADAIGTFQLVEGVVLEVAKHKKRYFLNFGADWREDFTITIAPANARRFVQEVDPSTYKGKKIRVRGWVEDYNGRFDWLSRRIG